MQKPGFRMGACTSHLSMRPQACRCVAHRIAYQSRNTKALSGAGGLHQLFKQYRGTTAHRGTPLTLKTDKDVFWDNPIYANPIWVFRMSTNHERAECCGRGCTGPTCCPYGNKLNQFDQVDRHFVFFACLDWACLKGGDLNPGERLSRVTRDDGTVTLCALPAATVLSSQCCTDLGLPLANKGMSHSRDGPAPWRTSNGIPPSSVTLPFKRIPIGNTFDQLHLEEQKVLS